MLHVLARDAEEAKGKRGERISATSAGCFARVRIGSLEGRARASWSWLQKSVGGLRPREAWAASFTRGGRARGRGPSGFSQASTRVPRGGSREEGTERWSVAESIT